MMSLSLWWYLAAHLLGDFYFQSPSLAEAKNDSYRQTLSHCSQYALTLIAMGLLLRLLSGQLDSGLVVVLILLHFVIDSIKYYYQQTSKTSRINIGKLYLIDQLAHLITIGLATYFFSRQGLYKEPAHLVLGAKGLLFTLWLFKPSNITFKMLFIKYQYDSQAYLPKEPALIKSQVPETIIGAGATIGNLERLIMGLFLYLNQYAAVGLVLTAKSITRYNKIAAEPAFSEYYLIGTLYSLLATLLPYVLIFKGH